MRSRLSLALATLTFTTLLSPAFGGQASARSADADQAEHRRAIQEFRADVHTRIRHVVIIIQENRSVDNLFNGFPGADTVSVGRSHEGPVALRPVDLSYPADVDHQHRAFEEEYDRGKMDGWDRVRTAPHQDHTFPYAYVPRTQIEPYWRMAEDYTFADRMFQSNTGPSFPAHLYLVAGESALTASNPNHLETTQFAWGCDSPPDARVSEIDRQGREVPGPWPCLDFPTLADLADTAHVDWRYYAPPLENLGNIWSAFDAIRHVRYTALWHNVVSPETEVLAAAKAGDLPAITWVVPTAQNSDHPFPRKPTESDVAVAGQHGPQWVASVVDASARARIGRTPRSSSYGTIGAAGTITSPPPQLDVMGLGFRVPMVVMSPYARHGLCVALAARIRKHPPVHGGDLRTAVARHVDTRADSLQDCFDFTRPPAPFRPIPALHQAAYSPRSRHAGRRARRGLAQVDPARAPRAGETRSPTLVASVRTSTCRCRCSCRSRSRVKSPAGESRARSGTSSSPSPRRTPERMTR